MMVAVKEIDLPLSETFTVKVLPEMDPVTEEGLGGFVPSSFTWSSWLISARRHSQSALVVTLVPETLVNGSGSFGVVADVGFVVSEEQVVAAVETVGVPELDVPLAGVVESVITGLDIGVDTGVDTGGVYMEVVGVVAAVPGRHWEYQSFEYVHTAPDTQVLLPV